MTDLLRVVLLVLVSYISAEQIIVENPQDQQAIIGDRAVLKCRVKNLQGEPQWCIDDFCLGVSKKDLQRNETIHLKGRPRYKIIGDRLKGEFHLLIEPVQLQDNMYFYCMVTAASETIKAVKSKRIFLTVLTYPQSLQLDSPVHVSLNKPSSIQCKAKQSRPPVKILISINGNVITDESKYKTEIIQYSAYQDDKKLSYVSSISAITNENLRQSYYDTITNLTIDDISIKMDGQSVECLAYSLFYPNQNSPIIHKYSGSKIQSNQQQVPNSMSTKSNIQVDYAPEVNLKMISTNRLLREEDVISLVCETRATPQIQSYKWYIGKNYLSGVKDSILNLKLRREMHLKTITCEASNTVASVKASLQLNILFKPSFKKGPKSYLVIDKHGCNKPLTLDCQVNSNPKSNITWYRRKFNYLKSTKTDLSNDKKVPYLFLFGLGSKLINQDQIYEDQLIGYGPTYTISSFNCANILNERLNTMVKKSNRKLKSKKVKRNSESFGEDGQDLDDQFKPVSYSGEYYDNYDYYDYEDDDYNDEYDEKQSQEINHGLKDSNDFGIYICDATNRLTEEPGAQTIRRYIKINPLGPPVAKILSLNQNVNSEEQVNLMMKTQEINENSKAESPIIEIATSIGSSVTMTCLVEPLPYLESLVWIKDNGKIIPNSRFSIQDQLIGNLTTNKTLMNNKNNYKIKHENLTLLFAQKQPNSDLNQIDEDQDIEEENFDFNKMNLVDASKSNDQSLSIVRSVLHIKNIRKQDFGIYKCKSTNSYGSRMSIILLREKTLLDKLNLNNYIVFILLISSIVLGLICFFMLVSCLFSPNLRNRLVCCLFDTNLKSEKFNFVNNESKVKINEWLSATNKLHMLNNESNLKQLKTTLNKNNTCSTTTEPLLMHSTSPLINDSSKSIKTSQTLTNSPRNESTANCSSLLDEEDDEQAKSDVKMSSYHPQVTRFMVSSPLTANNVNKHHGEQEQPSMLLIRSQNFNAKISNYDCVDNSRFMNTLQRQQGKTLHSKQDEASYRLSDLFNELSPMNTFSGTLNNRLYTNNVQTHSPSTSNQSPSNRCLIGNTNNLTLNKFPNPFDNLTSSNMSSSNQSYFHHLNI